MPKPWGKTEQNRLKQVFDYLSNDMQVAVNVLRPLRDWVYNDGVYEAASISAAMSLGARPLRGYDKGQRQAVRACIMARLAAERPPTLTPSNAWKTQWKKESEAALQTRARQYLAQLIQPAPQVLPLSGPPRPGAYGVDRNAIIGAKQALKRPVAKPDPVAQAAKPPAPVGGSFGRKLKYYDTTSRAHVVFSGHGSWGFDVGKNDWPTVTLKPHQKIRYYVPHYWPLGNAVGQMVDSRRFPDPREESQGQVCDYTLHHRGDLKLLNHAVGDTKFVTVQTDTRLSSFINRPGYESVTFHWAACRVVFNQNGELWCPSHNAWEIYRTDHRPLPCVLTRPTP